MSDENMGYKTRPFIMAHPLFESFSSLINLYLCILQLYTLAEKSCDRPLKGGLYLQNIGVKIYESTKKFKRY